MNPCVDAILEHVADPAQIASISHYSQDARATSVSLKWAAQFEANNGSAEDVIAARPDLVIAGPHVALPTLAALERLKIPVVKIAVPNSIAQSKAQIRDLATRIGHPGAGAQLNARIDAALAVSRHTGPTVSALIWQGGGLVPGEGTLADDMLRHTGFRNMAKSLGLGQWDILSLEAMLATPPQIVLSGDANMDGADAGSNRMLNHPVMAKARRAIRMANYPSHLLHCGGPVIIPAVTKLAHIRRSQ